MTTVTRRHTSARPQRRRAERERARHSKKRAWLPLTSLGVFILAAAIVAVVVAGRSGTTPGLRETASVHIEGVSLPAPSVPDPAVGKRAPAVQGVSFDGSTVSIPVAGKPTVVVLVAHWCLHCRNDIPVIQSYLEHTGTLADIAIRTLSTWVDASRPNYPPSAWFRDAGWSPPVLVDDAEGSAAAAYGLQGTPMFVFVGADGVVKFRMAGELDATQFATALQRLRSTP